MLPAAWVEGSVLLSCMNRFAYEYTSIDWSLRQCVEFTASKTNQNQIMPRWGDDKTLLFVTYYRSHECLWNTRSPLYKNNIALNNDYEALLNDMNDPSLTLKIIKTKIKNLRSVYHSEIKKINSSKRSGAGAEDVYKPPMSWFTEMVSFMADTDDYRETVASELISINLCNLYVEHISLAMVPPLLFRKVVHKRFLLPVPAERRDDYVLLACPKLDRSKAPPSEALPLVPMSTYDEKQ
ncbi:hypothetical protein NQ314_010216 [Rhamnusium bicolor]|uniref:MADF domain-containing protein n=1 Tax=Rhamnusium bicolor TaxID=1586634 RepID=A0AAV8XUQ9_9CUCU|nr:hypothetical protein NQ314_010216 [Rhamnusium bicolor]